MGRKRGSSTGSPGAAEVRPAGPPDPAPVEPASGATPSEPAAGVGAGDVTPGMVVPEVVSASGVAAPEADLAPATAIPEVERPPLPSRLIRRTVTRFVAAFLFGLLAILAIAAGVLAAYETSNAGRIVAGVHVGSVDLSGLTPAQAAARLREGYAGLSNGQLVLAAANRQVTVSFADLGRRVDVDEVVARAMAIGRGGPGIERIAANVRTLVRGILIAPSVTFEGAALELEIASLAKEVAVAPLDASVTRSEAGFRVVRGASGRAADLATPLAAAEALLTDPAAPALVRVELPVRDIPPVVSDEKAIAAFNAAAQISVDVALTNGGESWTIPGSALHGWITFGITGDGGYGPVVSREGLETGLAAIADAVAVAPVSATFLISDGNDVVGVSPAVEGRALDVPNTVAALEQLIDARVKGLLVPGVPISLATIQPELTTEEAARTAPLMRPISEWTTWFPYGIRNGNGANIWIPARDINGMVVMPGETFDFWKAIGPITRERGYKDGGAIIDGHTEPQGALAGGICSCSTTIFNAALRAGLEMGERLNHYYYINRYPLGLDATVFQSSSGSIQTMTWRNDTSSPILIRSYGWRTGAKGYVKFVLWSAPTGRTVELTTPIVKNIKPGTDSTVYTTDLAPGVKERVEFPDDGKDVWVTRIVRDVAGVEIHRETYYSHYAQVTGVLQVGIAPTPTPSPGPTPTP
jgi:vancomycin resistance protein YoaR